MKIKTLLFATLLPCILATQQLSAQIPPGIDPSQVVSGRTYAGRYEYQMKDGSTQEGRVHTIADPKHGSAVIITVPDRGGADHYAGLPRNVDHPLIPKII